MSEFEAWAPMFGSHISVVVATFGSQEWADRGHNTATDCFLTQAEPPEVLWVHGDNLAIARNEGAAKATNDWVVFLDADDKLDPEFCSHIPVDDVDVIQTSVRGFRIRDDEMKFIEPGPAFYPKRWPLIKENYLIIGSPIRTKFFLQVGGFEPWPCLEDWELWLRCERAGARFGQQPKSCYLINDDHHRSVDNPGFDVQVAQEIRRKYQ